MEDVAGVHAELRRPGNDDHASTSSTRATSRCRPRATPARRWSSAGAERETVTLAPSGENALKGDAKKPIAKGAAITVTLKTAAAKTGQARFKQ